MRCTLVAANAAPLRHRFASTLHTNAVKMPNKARECSPLRVCVCLRCNAQSASFGRRLTVLKSRRKRNMKVLLCLHLLLLLRQPCRQECGTCSRSTSYCKSIAEITSAHIAFESPSCLCSAKVIWSLKIIRQVQPRIKPCETPFTYVLSTQRANLALSNRRISSNMWENVPSIW